jgi:hypothetical protein
MMELVSSRFSPSTIFFVHRDFNTNVLYFASLPSIAIGENPLMDYGSIPLEGIA